MSKLNQKPAATRFQLAKALSSPVSGDRVDYAGGKWSAGIIRGVSVLTIGEALGHGFWCDATMLDQCQALLDAKGDKGLKCRFTHPGLCADGLAKGLGVFLGSTRVGTQIIADQHFNSFAHTSPDGNLAKYVMDRANEAPEHFGTSIVFVSDPEAEKEFMLAHGGRVVMHEDGWGTYETIEGFESPDEGNVDNLPHARIAELWACDVVDDPAANPNGFFHRDLSTVKSGEEFLDFVLGFSANCPEGVSLGVDPDRARHFIQAYAARRGLSLPKESSMFKLFNKKGKLAAGDPEKDPNKPADTQPAQDKTANDKLADEPTKPADGEGDKPAEGAVTCPECGAVFVPGEPTADEPTDQDSYAAKLGKYVEAFGTENGSKWFLGKVKFSDAKEMHFKAQLAARDSQLAAKDKEIAKLQADLNTANERLSQVAQEGAKPLGSSPAPKGSEGGKGGSSKLESLFQTSRT